MSNRVIDPGDYLSEQAVLERWPMLTPAEREDILAKLDREIQAQALIVKILPSASAEAREAFRRAVALRSALQAVRLNYHGAIYVVAMGEFVKIGFARDPAKRLHNLQVGSPLPLSIVATFPGTRDTEDALHERFTAYRTRGEWFCRQGELAAWIDAGCPLEP